MKRARTGALECSEGFVRERLSEDAQNKSYCFLTAKCRSYTSLCVRREGNCTSPIRG